MMTLSTFAHAAAQKTKSALRFSFVPFDIQDAC